MYCSYAFHTVRIGCGCRKDGYVRDIDRAFAWAFEVLRGMLVGYVGDDG